MTEQEIQLTLKLGLRELAEMCQNVDTLITVIDIVYQKGKQDGQAQAHRYYYQMFTGSPNGACRN